MPTIVKNNNQLKVACFECIRGHRSSSCTHTNKVLIEVRKPGRPLNNTTSLSSPSGSAPSNLQPAYVVFGHSQRQCPSNGVIPQDDWLETEAKPYPKSAALKQEAASNRVAKGRVSKTDGKSRSRKGTLSRSSTKQRSDTLTDFTSSPAVSEENESNTGSNIATSPDLNASLKASCCGSKATSSGLEEGAVDNESDIDTLLRRSLFTLPGSTHDSSNAFSVQRGIGRKVVYDKRYDALDDDEFVTLLRSLPPADLRAKFPYDVSVPQIISESSQSEGQGHQLSHDGDVASHKCHSHEEANEDDGNVADGCCCGDDCLCLGCSTHPANATTLKHVEDATKFMLEDPAYQQEEPVETDYVEAILEARKQSVSPPEASSQPQQSTQHYQPPPFQAQIVTSVQPPNSLWPQRVQYAAWHAPPQQALSGPTAILLTGWGGQQQIIPLQIYGGHQNSGQVFVLAPPSPPKCFDAHGRCTCGSDCTCEGCQTHKNPQYRPDIAHPGGPHVYAPAPAVFSGPVYEQPQAMSRPQTHSYGTNSRFGSVNHSGPEQARSTHPDTSHQSSSAPSWTNQPRPPDYEDFAQVLDNSSLDPDFWKHTLDTSLLHSPLYPRSPVLGQESPHAWTAPSYPTTQP